MSTTQAAAYVTTRTMDKVWDVALKALVPLAFAAGGLLLNHELRLSRVEQAVIDAQDDIRDQSKKLDRILDKLDTVGNRLTSLETKLSK